MKEWRWLRRKLVNCLVGVCRTLVQVASRLVDRSVPQKMIVNNSGVSRGTRKDHTHYSRQSRRGSDHLRYGSASRPVSIANDRFPW